MSIKLIKEESGRYRLSMESDWIKIWHTPVKYFAQTQYILIDDMAAYQKCKACGQVNDRNMCVFHPLLVVICKDGLSCLLSNPGKVKKSQVGILGIIYYHFLSDGLKYESLRTSTKSLKKIIQEKTTKVSYRITSSHGRG